MATSPIWASRPKTRGLVLDLIRSAVAAMPPEQALPLLAAQVDALLATAAVDRDKVLGSAWSATARRTGVSVCC